MLTNLNIDLKINKFNDNECEKSKIYYISSNFEEGVVDDDDCGIIIISNKKK